MNKIQKTFIILYLGQAVSQFTSSVLQMAIVWHLIADGASAMIVSLSGIMAFLPQGIIGLFVGVYIDRHNRKKIMIWSDILIAIAGFLLVIAGMLREIPITLILLVLAIRSAGTAFHQPSLGAVIPLIVPKEQLSKYAGYAQGLQSISLILSPAIAAALFAVWELPYIILLDCFGTLFAVICLTFVSIPNVKYENQNTPNFLQEFSDGLDVIKTNKLFSFMVTGGLFSLVYMPIFVLYPMMTLNYFNKTQWEAGIVEILFAIGMLIGAFILSRIKTIHNKIDWIGIANFIMALCLLFSGLLPANGFILFAVLSAILGFASPFYQGLQAIVFQERITNEYLGRAMSLSGALMVIGTPIGFAFSGIAADIIGLNRYFIFSGVLLIVTSLIYFANAKYISK